MRKRTRKTEEEQKGGGTGEKKNAEKRSDNPGAWLR